MTATLDSLLSHLVAHPEDAPSTWLVLANWLEEHGDPRWELIRLRHDRAYRPELSPAQREARVQALLAGGMKPCVPRLVNSIGMEFAWIAPGTFLMGSPPEEADRRADEVQHEVEISTGFYLGVHQVTQQQYRQVTKKFPSYFRKGGRGKNKVEGLDTKRFPVECVSWYDAVRFCERLTTIAAEQGETCLYRLPTEAEWEYSCRGGALVYQVFHFGDQLSSGEANFNGEAPYGGADMGDDLQRPVAVDDPHYRPNAFGLYHMHGNVWEWCSDYYGADYYNTCIELNVRQNPQGPDSPQGRVLRGGSWLLWPELSLGQSLEEQVLLPPRLHRLSCSLREDCVTLPRQCREGERCSDWSDTYPSGKVGDRMTRDDQLSTQGASMTPALTQFPLKAATAGFRPLSVAEYNHLTEIGLLTENDNVELLEGVMVYKMPRTPAHDGTLHATLKRLMRELPTGWDFRAQGAIVLADSVPEPDIAIVRLDPRDYKGRHPTPPDIGLVVEVSDSTLDSDRQDKCRIYARAGLVRYWIVNIPDNQVEVYEQPSGPTAAPAYALRTDYRLGDALPLILG